MLFAMFIAAVLHVVFLLCRGAFGEDVPSTLTLPMPKPNPPAKHNDYWCVVVKLPETDSYIVKYEPHADPKVAHHMLLYGCKTPHMTSGSWACHSGNQICSDQSRFLFAWAKGAEGITLPEGVGFFVGPSSDHYAVMQIHYGQPSVDAVDTPALTLYLTTAKQPRIAGIFLLVGTDTIPPNKQDYTISSACEFAGPNAIHPFAYRTHAHSLCKQIDGYAVKDNQWDVIGSRSPQDPQAFYPVKNSKLEIIAGDWLTVRCIYNSVGQSGNIYMGSTSEDEMCNFYIMYDMPNNGKGISKSVCSQSAPNYLAYPPVVSVTPIPNADTMEKESHHGIHDDNSGDGTKASSSMWAGDLIAADGWLYSDPIKASEAKFGQISAVAVGSNGTIYILHRGNRIWDGRSFSAKYTYNYVSDGPITVPCVVAISPTGELLSSWGEGLFYLPHGLTIDHDGNFWITDVAMHQVFKFNPTNLKNPVLTKGTQFMPGSGQDYFCQPAAVAVERSGMFYVADGYCNSRVVRFTKDGVWDIAWGDPVGEVPIAIRVAHSLVILEEEKILFLADRENSRILSYNMVTGEGRVFSSAPVFGAAIFAISFSANGTWPMVAINGHTDHNSGFTINKKGTVVSQWGPTKGFSQPHSIAVSPSCEVYVAEIGPNVLWKFLPVMTVASAADNSVLESPTEDQPQGSVSVNDISISITSGSSPSVENVSSYSLVLFIAVFGISAIIIFIMVAIICYFSNQQQVAGAGSSAKKTIQTLLKPKHAGFTKLQTYDSASEDEHHAVSIV